MAKIFYELRQNKNQLSKIYGKWFAHSKAVETMNTRTRVRGDAPALVVLGPEERSRPPGLPAALRAALFPPVIHLPPPDPRPQPHAGQHRADGGPVQYPQRRDAGRLIDNMVVLAF